MYNSEVYTNRYEVVAYANGRSDQCASEQTTAQFHDIEDVIHWVERYSPVLKVEHGACHKKADCPEEVACATRGAIQIVFILLDNDKKMYELVGGTTMDHLEEKVRASLTRGFRPGYVLPDEIAEAEVSSG